MRLSTKAYRPRLGIASCAVFLLAMVLVSASSAQVAPSRPPVYGFKVVNTYPHDAQAYTQGLIFRGGFLYESTGLNGRSSLRKVRIDTGQVVQQRAVDAQYFAEGLTEFGGRLIQLTWQSQTAFVYDLATFKPLQNFRYAGEGWGLTHDGARLILSDGTDTLRFMNPTTFREEKRVAVRDGATPVKDLNELEYVQGEIYANVWHTNRIARISPATGRVVGWIDLSGILPAVYQNDPEGVLNGIAFDAEKNRLFVTGKLWPRLFEIKLERR